MAAEESIPVYTSLDKIYVGTKTILEQGARWNSVADEFRRHFGRLPDYISRAPGRVNLIGEHIDYALFGVLPAAIERDVLMAFCARDDTDRGRVVVENMESKYTRQTFVPTREKEKSWSLDIDKTQLRWESYVKAGYLGVLDRFFGENDTHPRGIDLLVAGSVPPGSGLSSSAAMVVASTLSFLTVNNKLEGVTKGDLVEMAVKNERRVGVNSGGMDQSASVISNTESALYVSFFPRLAATAVPLPITSPRSVFVCANSLVVSDKVVHSKTRYNLRVVETLVGARILARRIGVNVGPNEKVTFREVLDRWLGAIEGEEPDPIELKSGLESIAKHLDGLKSVDGDGSNNSEIGLSMDEMIKLSGLSEHDFKELYLSWVDIEAERFQIYKRAKHVFSEAWRVLQFREVCLRKMNSEDRESDTTLRELGQLMDESQKSCAELFECSCPELDQLTRLAKEAGAYGSRLTGAGWGGCTVSLVEEAQVPEFISMIRSSYPPYHGMDDEELSGIIFPTKPSSGACLFKFT